MEKILLNRVVARNSKDVAYSRLNIFGAIVVPNIGTNLFLFSLPIHQHPC